MKEKKGKDISVALENLEKGLGNKDGRPKIQLFSSYMDVNNKMDIEVIPFGIKSVDEATEGMELALSIPGSNFERKIKDKTYLYAEISEKQFKIFKKNKDLLSQSEIKTLQEIAEIKRRSKDSWGL